MPTHGSEAAGDWFVRHAGLVAAGSTLLDVGAGRGRHSRFFAGRGASVIAVDRDAQALAELAGVGGITIDVRDLEQGDWPYAPESFATIVVSNYLWRPTFGRLLATLSPGGVLLYETFMDGNGRFGKPSRPDFLLRSNELLALTHGDFRVVAFEEGEQFDAEGNAYAVKQRIAAVRR